MTAITFTAKADSLETMLDAKVCGFGAFSKFQINGTTATITYIIETNNQELALEEAMSEINVNCLEDLGVSLFA
jgi:hypothetical protein